MSTHNKQDYIRALVIWSELRQCIRDYFRDYQRVYAQHGFSDQDAIDTAEANYAYAIQIAVKDLLELDQDILDWLYSGPVQPIASHKQGISNDHK